MLVFIEEKNLLDRSFADYFEGPDSVIVKGRLRVNIKFWESIGTSQSILGVIRDGYRIPFYCILPSVFLLNNKSAFLHSEFVKEAIRKLLRVGSVVQCHSPPKIVNPLSVSIQSNGEKRLVLVLRQVNFFVRKLKIKFEDAKSFLECLLARSAPWAFSFDIKSGHHHVESFKPDQEFSSFSGGSGCVTKYFKFKILP